MENNPLLNKLGEGMVGRFNLGGGLGLGTAGGDVTNRTNELS